MRAYGRLICEITEQTILKDRKSKILEISEFAQKITPFGGWHPPLKIV
jgi:hypothetical protein